MHIEKQLTRLTRVHLCVDRLNVEDLSDLTVALVSGKDLIVEKFEAGPGQHCPFNYISVRRKAS